MARFENEFSRSNQMAWGESQGNGHRGQFASGRGGPAEYGGWGSGDGQGEYGGQGFMAQGDFTGRGLGGPGYGWQDYEGQGYGRPAFGQPGMGWQHGPGGYGMERGLGWRQRSFAGPDIGEEGRFGGWRGPGYGGYGPTGRMMSEDYGPRGFTGQGRGWPQESVRGYGPQGWGAQGGPYGYWGQGRSDWDLSPSEGQAREMLGSAPYPEGWTPGPYTGRGPRGYRRSDARIEEDVNERLTRNGMIDASDIDVRVQNGEVTLSGTVDSRRSKRLAEDIIDSISGVQDITNQLRVRHDEQRMGQEGEAGASKQGQARGQAPRAQNVKTPAGATA